MLPTQEWPWVVCSSSFPHKTTGRRSQGEGWSTAEKNKRSLDLLTRKTLTYGHPGLTGHYDERQAGKHQPWLNSCFSHRSHPEVTNRLSRLPKYTHKSRRHHPNSFSVIGEDTHRRPGDAKGCRQELPVALPHPKDPSMWWSKKSLGLSSAQRLSKFSQDPVSQERDTSWGLSNDQSSSWQGSWSQVWEQPVLKEVAYIIFHQWWELVYDLKGAT